MDFKKTINKLVDKLKNLDNLGKLSLIRWGLFLLALILIIPCELVNPGILLAIFAILLWVLVIAGIVLSVIVAKEKKKRKRNKSY